MIQMLFSHILHIAVCNWCKRYLWPGMKRHEAIWNPLHQISWICSGQAKTAIVQSVKRGEQRKATISWTEWKIEWKVKGQKWPEIPKVTAWKRFETGDSQEHFPEFQLLCGMHRNLPPLSCEAAALSQNNKHIKHLQNLQWIYRIETQLQFCLVQSVQSRVLMALIYGRKQWESTPVSSTPHLVGMLLRGMQ